MLAHPQGGELSQRPHLRKGDRLERMAETEPAATLHLTEDQGEPCAPDIRSDNVDLSEPTAPIALQHLHALPLQLSTGQILPAYAELLLRLRLRHRPPPYGSMRTRIRNRAGAPNLWKPSASHLWKRQGEVGGVGHRHLAVVMMRLLYPPSLIGRLP